MRFITAAQETSGCSNFPKKAISETTPQRISYLRHLWLYAQDKRLIDVGPTSETPN